MLATASAFVPTGKIGTQKMTMKAQKTASTPSKWDKVYRHLYRYALVMTIVVRYTIDIL
jgi:hypothetical protein